jgi:hypothetical protein
MTERIPAAELDRDRQGRESKRPPKGTMARTAQTWSTCVQLSRYLALNVMRNIQRSARADSWTFAYGT